MIEMLSLGFFLEPHLIRITRTSLVTGHGGQQEDLDGDEEDGFDETLIPVDFDKHGHIVDDDILKVRGRLRIEPIFCYYRTILYAYPPLFFFSLLAT